MKKIITPLIMLLGFVCASQAAVHFVTSPADSGPSTLRDAVANAVAGDEIYFDVTDTIKLQTGIGITVDNLSLYGFGVGGIVITRQTNGRIMTANSNVVSSLFIQGITFTGARLSGQSSGNAKGAAFRLWSNTKGVVFENCLFHDNKVTNTQGPSGGGAVSVDNGSDVTFKNCHFWENEAVNCVGGAAVFIHGSTATANLENCSLYDNRSISTVTGSRGGAISCWDGILDLQNCTITGNSIQNTSTNQYAYAQGGGVALAQGTSAKIVSCTIVENWVSIRDNNEGAGLFISGSSITDFRNNIIAKNIYYGTLNNDTIQRDVYGASSSDGFNLIEEYYGTFSNQQPTDILGVAANFAPMESAGHNYYHPVYCSSPAYDAGDNSVSLTTDQLGNPRNAQSQVDIGAYEFQGPLPVASVNSFNVSCYGESGGRASTAAAFGESYQWSNGGTSSFVKNLIAGDYYLVATNIANGCTDTAYFTISQPDELVVIATPTHICDNTATGAIDVTVTGGVGGNVFDWDNDGSGDFDDTEDLSNISGGPYTLVVKDDNECTKSIDVTVIESPAMQLQVTPGGVSCYGESDGELTTALSGGISPILYDWDNDGTGDFDDTPNQVGLIGGAYVLVVQDSLGCQKTTNVNVYEPSEIVITGVTTPDNGSGNGAVDISVTGGSGVYFYQWDDLANSTTEDISGLTTGVYTVDLEDEDNCGAQESFNVSIITALNGSFDTEEGVYPNPVQSGSILYLSIPMSSSKLISASGTVERSFDGEMDELDLTGVRPGIYMLSSPERSFKVEVN